MSKLIYTQQNGDTTMILFDNGTRILDNKKDTSFDLEWPVSVDLNISNYCTKGCSFCYAGNTKEGTHADLDVIKNILHPYMEVAININQGYPIDMKFVDFLEFCRDNNIIVNATINQDDLLMHRLDDIKRLQEYNLLRGIGISLTNIGKALEFMKDWNTINNVVIHAIAGIVTPLEMDWLVENEFNVLILGYKQKGRAKDNVLPDMSELKEWLKINLLKKNKSVICFDNKAIEQLDVKSIVPELIWNECYQGDEGTISMYVDGVAKTFACNSFTEKHYPINELSIQEMFNIVRKER